MGGKERWIVPEVMDKSGASGVERWVILRRNWRVCGLVGSEGREEEGRRVELLLKVEEGVVGVWGEEGVGGGREVIVVVGIAVEELVAVGWCMCVVLWLLRGDCRKMCDDGISRLIFADLLMFECAAGGPWD